MLWTDPANVGRWVPLTLSTSHKSNAAFVLPSKWGMRKIHVGPTNIGKIRAKKVGVP